MKIAIRNQINRVIPVDEPNDTDPVSDVRRLCERALAAARSGPKGRNNPKLDQLSFNEAPKKTRVRANPFMLKKLEKKFMREHPTFKGFKMPVSNNLHAGTPSEVTAALKLLELDDPKDRASIGGDQVAKDPLKEPTMTIVPLEEVKKLTTLSGRPVYLEI
ncbi:hypothetical protein ACHQM5_019813 [Ranunculus cassubicifolius]